MDQGLLVLKWTSDLDGPLDDEIADADGRVHTAPLI